MHRQMKQFNKFCVSFPINKDASIALSKMQNVMTISLVIVAAVALFAFGKMDALNIIPTETSTPVLAFSDDPSAISIASQSVVKLNCYDKNDKLYSMGSGFACFADNIILYSSGL